MITSTPISIQTSNPNLPTRQYSSTSRIFHKYRFKYFIPIITNPEALTLIFSANKGAATAVEAIKDGENSVTYEKLSEIFQSTTVRAKYTKEIIKDYVDIKNLGKVIKITYLDHKTVSTNANITIVASDGNDPFLNNMNVTDILFSKTEIQKEKTANQGKSNQQTPDDSINTMYTNINLFETGVDNHTKSSPGLSVIQVLDPNIRACLKQSQELSVFFNLINTLDMSMAVPHLNFKFYVPSKYTQAAGKNSETRDYMVASFNNFFFGYSGGTENIDNRFTNFAKAINGDFYLDKYTYRKSNAPGISVLTESTDQTTTKVAEEYITTTVDRSEVDISLFTMPQSLVNGEETLYGDYSAFSDEKNPSDFANRQQPIHDKFRPLMSIESIDFDVRPTKELMSFKTATMNLVLYDKSRLNEVLAFVKPDLFGSFGSEILIEYGWQHILGDKNYVNENELSPIGEFINSLKCYEKYQIVNSSYSIQENGQVNITLNISMKGPADIRGTTVNPQVFEYVLTKNISMYISQLQNAGLTDAVSNERFLAIGSENIPLDNLTKENLTTLKTKFNEIHEKAQSTFQSRKGALAKINSHASRIRNVIDLLAKEASNATKKAQTNLETGILSFLENENDPFLASSFSTGIEEYKGENAKKYASLGKIILGLLGKLVATSYQYNEVQLVFFNLNEKAARARNLNIASIPVEKEKFKQWFTNISLTAKQISIEGIISLILRRYANEKASEVYGLNKWLKLNENSETTYIFDDAKNRSNNNAQVSKSQIAELEAGIASEIGKAYYGETFTTGSEDAFDLTFKLPVVRMTFDTMTHDSDDQSTILRVNFYDENDNPYEAMFDLLGNFQDASLKEKISTIHYLTNELAKDDDNQKKYQERSKKLIKAINELGTTEYLNAEGKKTQNFEEATRITIKSTNELTKGSQKKKAKEIFKQLLPSITFGASNSAVISANVSSMQDAKLSTVFMTRDEQNSAKSTQYQMFENMNLLPTRIIPSQVSAKMIGCPMINFGQMIFFDFNTNTSVDNAYIVTGIKHSISPGKFETDLTLTLADCYAKFLVHGSTIKTFLELAKNFEDKQKNQNDLDTTVDLGAADKAQKIKEQIDEAVNKSGKFLIRLTII
jgi:hypothetical protein